jgi:hypothetical protein
MKQMEVRAATFEELAQNGPLRAAIISAEFLSFMAAREGAPLCASLGIVV